MASQLETEIRGRAAIIRLNRPDTLNALTLEMLDELRARIEAAERDEKVVAIVLTGAGKGFCSGLDASVLADVSNSSAAPPSPKRAGERDDLPALFSYLPRVSKPVIAAINGVAAGAGFVLAMMSDMRFIAENAAMTTVFAKRGLIGEHLTTWMLPRMIGVGNALDLLWTARKVGAQEAFAMGLVERVVVPDKLLDAALGYVEELAANVSPRAIAVIKAQVYADLSESLPAAAWRAAGLAQEALAHPDAEEGVRSFLERRPPRFKPWPPRPSGGD